MRKDTGRRRGSRRSAAPASWIRSRTTRSSRATASRAATWPPPSARSSALAATDRPDLRAASCTTAPAIADMPRGHLSYPAVVGRRRLRRHAAARRRALRGRAPGVGRRGGRRHRSPAGARRPAALSPRGAPHACEPAHDPADHPDSRCSCCSSSTAISGGRCSCFSTAGVTDALDGLIARRAGQRTAWAPGSTRWPTSCCSSRRSSS